MIFILSFLTTWGVGLIVEIVTFKISGQAVWGDWLYNYTSPTVLIGAYALLSIFLEIKIESKLCRKIITTVSSTSLGVYLIHTSRALWKLSDGILSESSTNVWMYIFIVISMAVAIYIICSLIELLRIQLFEKCGINRFIKKVDNIRTVEYINSIWNE